MKIRTIGSIGKFKFTTKNFSNKEVLLLTNSYFTKTKIKSIISEFTNIVPAKVNSSVLKQLKAKRSGFLKNTKCKNINKNFGMRYHIIKNTQTKKFNIIFKSPIDKTNFIQKIST